MKIARVICMIFGPVLLSLVLGCYLPTFLQELRDNFTTPMDPLKAKIFWTSMAIGGLFTIVYAIIRRIEARAET